MPFQTELARCFEDIIAQLDCLDEGQKRLNIIMSKTSGFRALEKQNMGRPSSRARWLYALCAHKLDV
jgi:hypothetical protein